MLGFNRLRTANASKRASSAVGRLVSTLAVLALSTATAHAGFVTATWSGVGADPDSTYSRLLANIDQIGDERYLAIASFPSDDSTALSLAIPGYAAVEIQKSIRLGPTVLEADLTRFDRSARSSAHASGAWVFAVTEAVKVRASGYFDIDVSGVNTENLFGAELLDLTAEEWLFKSLQRDNDSTSRYELGGLDGNRAASMEGNLEAILLPGHLYRWAYGFGTSVSSAAGSSEATGLVRLEVVDAAIPEPTALSLACLALGLMLFTRRVTGERAWARSVR